MDLSKYFKYYDNLNEDLQNLILSKIRYPISKELDVDIVNFKTFKEDVINTYLKKGFDYDIDGMFYIYYQIENDLIRFFNDDIATMDFITEKNIKKMERILSIKKKLEKNKKKTIDCLMNSTDSLQVNSRINILIGALTCEERSKFLKLFA
mgnify:FL=1|jgi:hypothetical protein